MLNILDKKMAQMKEQIKAPEKIQRSDEELVLNCALMLTEGLNMVTKYRKK